MSKRDEAYQDRLQDKLSDHQVVNSLISAGLFLTAFELLRSLIETRVEEHFLGMDIHGDRSSFRPNGKEEYRREVLSLAADTKHVFHASCLWLESKGALSRNDVTIALRVRNHRNDIAHELPALLVEPDRDVSGELLDDTARLIRLIGRHWVRLNIDGDERFDHREIADDDIQSGEMVLLEHILRARGTLRP